MQCHYTATGQLVCQNESKQKELFEAFTVNDGLTSSGTSTLLPGQSIYDSSARYMLVYQRDGNLVMYPAAGAIWSTNTAGKSAGKAVMQTDGNFVLYDANNKPYWATNTNGQGKPEYRLSLQADRNLVLYDKTNRATWASGTNI